MSQSVALSMPEALQDIHEMCEKTAELANDYALQPLISKVGRIVSLGF